MSDLERVEFKIKLSSNWFRWPPHVMVYLDDTLIKDFLLEERKDQDQAHEIAFDAELDEGNHELRIRYLDKSDADTMIADDGSIADDTLINIESVEIDEIDLGFLTYSKSKFLPDQDIRPDLPAEMRELVNIGYNGMWVLRFQVPTYIWFLENL